MTNLERREVKEKSREVKIAKKGIVLERKRNEEFREEGRKTGPQIKETGSKRGR